MKKIQLGFLSLLMLTGRAWANGPDYLSPVDITLSRAGKAGFVAMKTASEVGRLALPDCELIERASLKQNPSGIALSPDGKVLYVTAGVEQGVLYVLAADSLTITQTIPLGHTPVSPVVSPDGKTVYVCNRMDDSIASIDMASGEVVANTRVVREPFDMDLTPDGKLLFVANHIPAGRADLEYVACEVSVIDTATRKVIKAIKLVNGAEGMRGIRVSPDGQYVYATHLMARFLVPTTQIERGWINTNALSAIRVSDLKLLFTVLLDDVDLGFANPWGIAINDDASVICVAAAGTHELSLIDLPAMTAKIEAKAKAMGEKLDSVHLSAHNDLSFLSSIRKRVQLEGIGPRSIAMHADTIYATEFFSDSIGRVTVANGEAVAIDSIPLGPKLEMTPVRRGDMLFNDATICFQKWQSCASCHPDARTDALNWDLLNDGIGNPKNVKSLVLSHATPPVMALGVRSGADVAVRAGIRYIQFAVSPEEDARAIDAYLRSLKPDPSPYLMDGKLSAAACRGKKVFDEAYCAVCHPAPLYTDLQKYDVGTGKGQDKGKAFDTPTLREVWRTSPYMHDGRAETIYEVITTHNPADSRGETSGLSEKEKRDLVEYVLSL